MNLQMFQVKGMINVIRKYILNVLKFYHLYIKIMLIITNLKNTQKKASASIKT